MYSSKLADDLRNLMWLLTPEGQEYLKEKKRKEQQTLLETLAAQGIDAIPFEEIDPQYKQAAERERREQARALKSDRDMRDRKDLEMSVFPLQAIYKHQYQFALYGRIGQLDAIVVEYTPRLCNHWFEHEAERLVGRFLEDPNSIPETNPAKKMTSVLERVRYLGDYINRFRHRGPSSLTS